MNVPFTNLLQNTYLQQLTGLARRLIIINCLFDIFFEFLPQQNLRIKRNL